METYRSGWFNLAGYLACSVRYADGSKRTVLQHREVMETHLNRTLSSSEVVHHIDGDKRNNDITNLEILSRSTHGKHHAKDAAIVHMICLNCGVHILCKVSVERRRIKRGVTGPYCTKSCAGKASRKKQIAEGKINLRAMVVKKANTLSLGGSGEILVGSTPTHGTETQTAASYTQTQKTRFES